MSDSYQENVPVMQFDPPSDQIVQTADGYESAKSLGWIKFSSNFRNQMLRELKGAKLSVFMCISLHLNDKGISFPSIDLIAEETGYHRDTVMEALGELEQIPNLLSILRKRGKANKYRPYFVSRGPQNEPVEPVGKTRPVGNSRLEVLPTGFAKTSRGFPDSKKRELNTSEIKEITDSANKTVDDLLNFERAAHAAETQGKAWKHREDFGFNEHVLALADKCSQRFGAPSKRDITVWVLELGSWVDAGARVADWERAEEIVAGYSQPVLTVTGMTKAVKFAAQERKNGTAPQSREPREEDHPEWKKFVAPENTKYVPAPPRKRVAVS